MPEVDRAVKVLDDGRCFTITYGTPGFYLLKGFLSQQSEAAGEDPILAAPVEVPEGRPFLTDQQASEAFEQLLPEMLTNWPDMCSRLGIAPGATRR